MNSKIEELQTRPVQPKPGVPAYHDVNANPQTWAFAGVPTWRLATAGAVGALVALVTIPTWVPILGSSLAGTEPKVYWYLSRASGLTAFALLWVSMASGLLISNRMARVWPGAFTAFDLHQFTSLLGLGFGLFHVAVLLGNLFVPYSLVQLLVPFADAPYRPLWVALGQVGLYLLIPVTLTFYIRRQIGNRLWRLIHFVSYAVFAMVLLHGLFSGTDSGNIWVLAMYWATAASMLVLTMYRLTVKQRGLVRQ
jgi:predicted ferric reductase